MYPYFIPTVNLMGAGCAAEVGKQAKVIGGSKALVVTDKPLVEIGVVEEDLPALADNALKDVCGLTNPRIATKEDIVQIYKDAM